MSAIKARMNKVTDMLGCLMSRMPSESNPTIIPKIPTLGGGDVISLPSDDGRNDSRSIPRTGNGSGLHSAVAPPVTYNSLPLPEPHFAHACTIPILNKDAYLVWSHRMKRHVKGSSVELWHIVEEGFNPRDRHNMTPREYRDNIINSHAMLVIGNGLKEEQYNLVLKCETTKEMWDILERTLMGSSSIRCSKFDKIQDQADHFVRNEGESSEDVHQRLVALANSMTEHGSMDTDDGWIKRNFITAMLLHKKHITTEIG